MEFLTDKVDFTILILDYKFGHLIESTNRARNLNHGARRYMLVGVTTEDVH